MEADILWEIYKNNKFIMKKFKYHIIDKIVFYSCYIFYKFLVLFETKKPKVKLFLLDIFYSLINLIYLLNKSDNLMKNFYRISNIDYVETIFGKFFIRKNTIDPIIVSPSFERRDVNFLTKKISEEILDKKKILFLDIGADFGYYSILLSNIFKNNSLLKICSFEPASKNRSLFEKNIKLNNCKNIEVFPFAIYKENDLNISIKIEEEATGSNSILLDVQNNDVEVVKTRTIDDVLIDEINNFDIIFMKIDIEGFETEALIGAKKLLKSNKKIYLMVEDFVDNRIIDFLENTSAAFVGKFNNYNSWWKFQKR